MERDRVLVRARDIVAIDPECDGSTLCLAPHLARRSPAKSLREWEQRLPDRQFVRIRRFTIVHLDDVARLSPGRTRARTCVCAACRSR